jgi:broad-specificity NMP kinase
MRKIIAFAGRPGTGKSTLFRAFMEGHTWKRVDPVKLVSAEYCEELDLYILGKYDEGETFPGTDKLSMATQPEVCKWLETHSSNVIFEGDRLTGSKMYDFLAELPDTDFHIFVLHAGEQVLKERYAERGSDQPEQFLKAKETKINNILSNFDYRMSTEEFQNNSLEDQAIILANMKDVLL